MKMLSNKLQEGMDSDESSTMQPFRYHDNNKPISYEEMAEVKDDEGLVKVVDDNLTVHVAFRAPTTRSTSTGSIPRTVGVPDFPESGRFSGNSSVIDQDSAVNTKESSNTFHDTEMTTENLITLSTDLSGNIRESQDTSKPPSASTNQELNRSGQDQGNRANQSLDNDSSYTISSLLCSTTGVPEHTTVNNHGSVVGNDALSEKIHDSENTNEHLVSFVPDRSSHVRESPSSKRSIATKKEEPAQDHQDQGNRTSSCSESDSIGTMSSIILSCKRCLAAPRGTLSANCFGKDPTTGPNATLGDSWQELKGLMAQIRNNPLVVGVIGKGLVAGLIATVLVQFWWIARLAARVAFLERGEAFLEREPLEFVTGSMAATVGEHSMAGNATSFGHTESRGMVWSQFELGMEKFVLHTLIVLVMLMLVALVAGFMALKRQLDSLVELKVKETNKDAGVSDEDKERTTELRLPKNKEEDLPNEDVDMEAEEEQPTVETVNGEEALPEDENNTRTETMEAIEATEQRAHSRLAEDLEQRQVTTEPHCHSLPVDRDGVQAHDGGLDGTGAQSENRWVVAELNGLHEAMRQIKLETTELASDVKNLKEVQQIEMVSSQHEIGQLRVGLKSLKQDGEAQEHELRQMKQDLVEKMKGMLNQDREEKWHELRQMNHDLGEKMKDMLKQDRDGNWHELRQMKQDIGESMKEMENLQERLDREKEDLDTKLALLESRFQQAPAEATSPSDAPSPTAPQAEVLEQQSLEQMGPATQIIELKDQDAEGKTSAPKEELDHATDNETEPTTEDNSHVPEEKNKTTGPTRLVLQSHRLDDEGKQ